MVHLYMKAQGEKLSDSTFWKKWYNSFRVLPYCSLQIDSKGFSKLRSLIEVSVKIKVKYTGRQRRIIRVHLRVHVTYNKDQSGYVINLPTSPCWKVNTLLYKITKYKILCHWNDKNQILYGSISNTFESWSIYISNISLITIEILLIRFDKSEPLKIIVENY